MKLTLFTLALVSATAQACTPGLYGVGTCAPPVTASGNGDSVTPHIIHALGKCFKDKFGVGPWTFHGLASPDYSGVGNAWGVYKDFGDGKHFKFDVGNLCSCKQSVDSNILQDLVRKAESGSYETIEQRCAVNSANCPAAGAPGGYAPSGVYAAVQSCNGLPCTQAGAKKWEAC